MNSCCLGHKFRNIFPYGWLIQKGNISHCGEENSWNISQNLQFIYLYFRRNKLLCRYPLNVMFQYNARMVWGKDTLLTTCWFSEDMFELLFFFMKCWWFHIKIVGWMSVLQELLKRESKRSRGGISLMYVILFGLVGILLGYLIKKT